MNRKSFFILKWITGFILGPLGLIAQPSVRGPQCVTPGITYQYMINGGGDSASATQICITGGKIERSEKNCWLGGTPFLLITWNDSTAKGSISLSTRKGSTTLQINIVNPLFAGAIVQSGQDQRINYNTVYRTINCTTANGGSCAPNYSYQWQASTDCLNWKNILGATEQNLATYETLKETMYFRRKVIESSSNTERYSDVAIVFVNPDMEGHQSTEPIK